MNTIMMAFALSRWSDTGDYINWYGWIELGYNAEKEEVFVVGSAMIGSQWGGIYAGIPEPSTALLMASGCALLLLRRRRRE